MKLLILLVFCIGVSVANYGLQNSYGGSYGGGSYGANQGYDYQDDKHHHHHHKKEKKDFRKLKFLNLDPLKITQANEIQYYRDGDDVYAIITCTLADPAKYVWIMADSDAAANPGLPDAIAGSVPLAGYLGGSGASFIAKYGKNKKWTGVDFFEYEEREFTKVGCYQGSYGAQIDNKDI